PRRGQGGLGSDRRHPPGLGDRPGPHRRSRLPSRRAGHALGYLHRTATLPTSPTRRARTSAGGIRTIAFFATDTVGPHRSRRRARRLPTTVVSEWARAIASSTSGPSTPAFPPAVIFAASPAISSATTYRVSA